MWSRLLLSNGYRVLQTVSLSCAHIQQGTWSSEQYGMYPVPSRVLLSRRDRWSRNNRNSMSKGILLCEWIGFTSCLSTWNIHRGTGLYPELRLQELRRRVLLPTPNSWSVTMPSGNIQHFTEPVWCYFLHRMPSRTSLYPTRFAKARLSMWIWTLLSRRKL